jgi:pilus assembly protein CpaB
MPEGNDPKAEKAMIARVASRPSEGGSTFSTGADVSRFQRSTVPGKARDDDALPGAPAPAAGGAYPGAAAAGQGPVVKISRGNSVTVVPVGGKN